MQNVCACVLVISSETNKILAVSRKDDPSKLGLPGGKFENSLDNYSFSSTAIRETLEETGYTVFIPNPSQCFSAEDQYGNIVYTYIAYIDVTKPRKEVKEQGRVVWASVPELIEGPFGEYNSKLFSLFDRDTRWLVDK